MRTHAKIDAVPPPEAMADVPGVCELPLTRAIVQYRGVHEGEPEGGRIQDIGLALVLEGRYAAAAEGVDLGSGETKRLDLSTELVVLDWVYEPTLEHVSDLSERAGKGHLDAAALQGYLFELAVHVLRRHGFGPLTRPVLLRIGFRDICRDLDLHEGTSVRIRAGRDRLLRTALDYDTCTLRVRTSGAWDLDVGRLLAETFPGADVRSLGQKLPEHSLQHRVRFPSPLDFTEVRGVLSEIRAGLTGLVARFEPERYRGLRDVLDTLGARETLARLQLESEAGSTTPLASVPASPGTERVH